MAEKRVTAQKTGIAVHRHECPKCGADSRVTYYTGFGQKGFFWVCEKACGYMARTRQ